MPKPLAVFVLLASVLVAGGSADARQTRQDTPSDKATAARIADLRARAEQGYADAQYTLGGLYEDGRALPKDEAQAMLWYRKAAEQGHALAQATLGLAYDSGHVVPQDYAQAAVWYRKAAEQGLVLAQLWLGKLYFNGRGVPQDYAQAAMWLRKAAEQGDAEAQNSLGLMCSEGKGVPQDNAQAAMWLRKAAEQGLPSAQSSVGLMYQLGRGVPQDYSQAAAWYRKAAEQGHARAQYNLGLMYANGRGVTQDYVEAHMWSNLAASRASGDEQKTCAKLRDSITDLMTPAQVAESQRRAQAWKPAGSPTAPSHETAAASPAATTETAVGWRRIAPTRTSILHLKPEDRNPSPHTEMFERSAAAVVGLSGSQGTGTAFLITRDGLALTNHHVVDKQTALKATLRDGRQLAVRVLRSSPEADVALLQLNCATDCFTLDLARGNPGIGRDVHVIGNALALDYTLTRGIVSGLRLSRGVTLVQTDAAINPGNSGGPIIDAKTREVLAIVSWKVTAEGAEGVGFGVTIADALRVLGIQWQ